MALSKGESGLLREYADTENKAEKQVIPASNAVLDKYYLLLNPIFNKSYAILLVQSYTEESIQAPISALMYNLLGGNPNYHKVQIEPFVPQRLKEKYQRSAIVRMFSFTVPMPLSGSLRDTVAEANQEFEVEIRIRPKEKELSIDSQGTKDVIEGWREKAFEDKGLSEGKGKVYIQDAQGRNANFDIAKEIQSIRPTIYLSDEGIDSDPVSGLPDFQAIRSYCRGLLQEIRNERDINQEIDEF